MPYQIKFTLETGRHLVSFSTLGLHHGAPEEHADSCRDHIMYILLHGPPDLQSADGAPITDRTSGDEDTRMGPRPPIGPYVALPTLL